MANNILMFPVLEKTAETMKKRLEAQTQKLEEKYVELDEVHAKLHALEEQTSCMEERFNTALQDYAKVVGVENVPVSLMEYCSNAQVNIDGDALTFTLKKVVDELVEVPTQYSFNLENESEEENQAFDQWLQDLKEVDDPKNENEEFFTDE